MPTKVVRSQSSPRIRQTIELDNENQPAPPQVNAEDRASNFWEEINAISDENWGRENFVYLYRDNPKPNTKGQGYLAKITHAFDIEWVKQQYGGYDYRAILCDRNSKALGSLSFSVDALPKTSPENSTASTGASSSSTDSFQTQVLAMLREQGAQNLTMLREVIASQRVAPVAPASSTMETALGGLVEIFTKQVPQAKDPLELIAKLKELTPAQPDMFAMMVKMKELFGPSAAPGSSENLLGQLDQMLAVAEKLGAKTGGGGKQSVASVIAEKLAENVPVIIDGLGKMLDKWGKIAETNSITQQYRYAAAAAVASRGQAVPLPAGTVQAPAPRVSAPSPAAVRTAIGLDVEPVGSIRTVEGSSASAPTPIPGATEEPYDLLSVIKDRVVACIARGDEGGVIVDFLHAMDERLLQTFMGVSEKDITTFFQSDPILSQAVGLPRFKETISELVAELSEETPENEVEEKVN